MISEPPAVKAPVAITLCLAVGADVLMMRKCSVLKMSGLAALVLASARPAPLISAAAETRVVAAISVLRIVLPPVLMLTASESPQARHHRDAADQEQCETIEGPPVH